MKKLAATLSIVFLLSGNEVFANSTNDSPPVDCKTLNPFLGNPSSYFYKFFVLANIQQTNSTICEGMWSRTGTCCNEDIAKQRLNLQNRRIKDAMRYIPAAIGAMVGMVNQFQNTLDKQGENRSRLSKAFQSDEIQSIFKFLKDINIQQLQNSIGTCWNYMMVARGSSICSVCAGDSAHFFFLDAKKAAISHKECSVMVGMCSSFFKEALAFITGLYNLHQNLEKLEKTYSITVGFRNEFLGCSPDRTITKELAKVNDQSLPTDERQEIEAKVCGVFFRLEMDPFIVQMNSMVYYNKQSLAQLINQLNADIKRADNSSRLLLDDQVAPPSPSLRSLRLEDHGSRQLSTGTDSFGLFAGDIRVVTFISQIEDKLDSLGDEMRKSILERPLVRAMNLSIAFP